ncbi:alpha/beta hydrolase [Acidisoma cladoniae]|uniref:alpha/beta hydrolase n=1 Tax=Acidisoma cladoniae TaxID=3040935 RepID=UPI00254B7FF9|nr:alpha/beta hydrolase [Acidisoma sp. PAMC 29798]
MLTHPTLTAAESWCAIRPLTPEDARAMAAMRAMVEPHKGKMQGPGARGPFDAIMLRVVAPEGVSYRQDTVGGVPGWWCEPDGARPDATILHLHGGWFNWGSAEAFRALVGHIARSAGAAAFVPDYRLAPEHPFPAAVADVQACYDALTADSARRIALTGDSAGGNLALALLSRTTASGIPPVGTVVMSPVTDLAMTGQSWDSRAAADPYFTRPQAAALIASYLGSADPAHPQASPLNGELAGLPPVRVHVGDDEVLLDDSRRYVARAVAAGVDARLDVWQGMPHGFLGGIGRFAAASQALSDIGTFLSTLLRPDALR